MTKKPKSWNPVRIVVDLPPSVEVLDAEVSAALVSALKAIIPGFQQKRNLETDLTPARAAFFRTMHRKNRARAKKGTP